VQTLAAEISSPGPRRALGYFGCWQMLSKKSFLADERNFLAPLVRPTRCNVRDHIESHQSDRRPRTCPTEACGGGDNEKLSCQALTGGFCAGPRGEIDYVASNLSIDREPFRSTPSMKVRHSALEDNRHWTRPRSTIPRGLLPEYVILRSNGVSRSCPL
jgi:hypothetical protein